MANEIEEDIAATTSALYDVLSSYMYALSHGIAGEVREKHAIVDIAFEIGMARAIANYEFKLNNEGSYKIISDLLADWSCRYNAICEALDNG